jgi:hypothetical protein
MKSRKSTVNAPKSQLFQGGYNLLKEERSDRNII